MDVTMATNAERGDAALWQAAAAGEHDAFGGLFDRHAAAAVASHANWPDLQKLPVRLPSTVSYAVTAKATLGRTVINVPQAANSAHVVRASTHLGSVAVVG